MKQESRYTILKNGLVQSRTNASQTEPRHRLYFDSHADGGEMREIEVTTLELASLVGMLRSALESLDDQEVKPEITTLSEKRTMEQKISDVVAHNLARAKRSEAK